MGGDTQRISREIALLKAVLINVWNDTPVLTRRRDWGSIFPLSIRIWCVFDLLLSLNSAGFQRTGLHVNELKGILF